MKIETLQQFIEQRLMLEQYAALDASLNGLQCGRPDKEIHKIAFSVDATLETFVKAVEEHADALFVHHGLFWGKPLAVTDTHYARIATLIRHDIALFAAHLPLDAHPELGNNAAMAQMLHLKEVTPFGNYHGVDIGFKGVLPTAITAEEIVATLNFTYEDGLKILPFGKKEISRVGIVSGGAASTVEQAIEEGLDAFITGECSHSMYSYCVEAGITMICGGHYATEVFGVQKMEQEIKKKFDCETVFIDAPTTL